MKYEKKSCTEDNLSFSPCFIIYFILDVDECIDQTDNCDVNAFCNNTVGSFNCTCVSGYSGNGTTCVGEYQFLFFYSYKRVVWQGLPL